MIKGHARFQHTVITDGIGFNDWLPHVMRMMPCSKQWCQKRWKVKCNSNKKYFLDTKATKDGLKLFRSCVSKYGMLCQSIVNQLYRYMMQWIPSNHGMARVVSASIFMLLLATIKDYRILSLSGIFTSFISDMRFVWGVVSMCMSLFVLMSDDASYPANVFVFIVPDTELILILAYFMLSYLYPISSSFFPRLNWAGPLTSVPRLCGPYWGYVAREGSISAQFW